MKLAVVVQRYGPAVNGGAELHARYVAEHLGKHAEVEVLTTCATDYVTWRNQLPASVEQINGVTVRRFAVKHERNPELFGRRQDRVFDARHSLADELAWMEAQGPASPALLAYARKHEREFDHFIFFSYRYYHAFWGTRALPHKAILVPTAEREASIGLAIFPPIFRGVRGIMYNSPEERAMINAVSDNTQVPGIVVGIGSDVPQNPQAARFRQKYDIRGPFAIYVGRIDENKGCTELFEFFDAYSDTNGRLSLVLVGNSLLPIPESRRVRHLGFLDDADKFDAMAAADVLVMPSYFESLSMVALEAWALGRPVLVNGRCDVLKGQSIRSNAGLYYENEAEFVETLRAIEQNRWLAASLGQNGKQFYRDNYDWPVIERKYLEMIARLAAETARQPIEPLPGWFARRAPTIPPATEVLAGIETGPALGAPGVRDDRAAERLPEPTPVEPPPQERDRRPAPRPQAMARGNSQGSRQHQQRRGPSRGPRRSGGPPRSGRPS